MFVYSLAPEHDNITLISSLCKDDFGSKWPIFTEFRCFLTSLGPECRYGPGLVLGRDILVVYGVIVL